MSIHAGFTLMDKEYASERLPAYVSEQIENAVGVLREGGIVAYPTDTVYGLGADVYNDEAVKKVFAIKNRPLSLPLPVLIADAEQVISLTSELSLTARSLMERFWPGGLTIIFTKSPLFNSMVLAGGGKIGIRLPDHPVPRLLIKELGRPIAGTSANLHNRETALTATEVHEHLGGLVDFIIDAGRCPGGAESTIIDVTADPPRVLRHGIVPESEIRDSYRK